MERELTITKEQELETINFKEEILFETPLAFIAQAIGPSLFKQIEDVEKQTAIDMTIGALKRYVSTEETTRFFFRFENSDQAYYIKIAKNPKDDIDVSLCEAQVTCK